MSDGLPPTERPCWCGYPQLFSYSEDYHVCRACGTLVSRAPVRPTATRVVTDEGELYSRDYWLKRQTEHHALPDIHQRSRLDLPERCTHWLEQLLRRQLPPGRILEVGCGHGGFLFLLQQCGFSVVGTEMSPWVADFARTTFGVDVRAGLVEEQGFPENSFDVVVLHDVLEHLPAPRETFSFLKSLLRPGGFFLIQTPEYKEHLSYADLKANQDLFLRHMERNNEEHLYLFSRRSLGRFFSDLGYPIIEYYEPVYSYDCACTASATPLPNHPREAVAQHLLATPTARLALALLDKAYEARDHWWAWQRARSASTNPS